MLKEITIPIEVYEQLPWALELCLTDPLIFTNLDGLYGMYQKIEYFYGDKYKYLLEKINSLKYGKEAIEEATEEQLRNTFSVCISRSKEDKEYYKKNKEFMKEIYDRLLKIDKSCWYDYYRDLMELE
jgi:TRAP-type mannitol/chloroaromatic compound transport system substrate-binding protein